MLWKMKKDFQDFAGFSIFKFSHTVFPVVESNYADKLKYCT